MSKKGLDTKVALCRLQNETDCMKKPEELKQITATLHVRRVLIKIL